MRIRILSWNIWYDGDINAVNDFLENSNADIIGLQEVVDIGGQINLSKRLFEELGYKLVYTPVFDLERKGKSIKVGNAVLTKFPIQKSFVHNLSKEENRKAVQVDVGAGDKTLHIFSTHLLHTHQKPSKIQDEQAENLVKFVPQQNSVLMGDFNALPDSNAIKIISKSFINSDPNRLPTWSVYPEGCHICRPQGILYKLDYIFTSKDLKIHDYKVESSMASDHLPVSTIIEL